jgi:hypothetical protein
MIMMEAFRIMPLVTKAIIIMALKVGGLKLFYILVVFVGQNLFEVYGCCLYYECHVTVD